MTCLTISFRWQGKMQEKFVASEGNCGEIRRDVDAILHKVSVLPSLSLVALC